MVRYAPKSKKFKPAPKSKRVDKREPEVNSETEEDVNAEKKNGGSVKWDAEDHPPAKRGRPTKRRNDKAAATQTSPAKKGGRASLRPRKKPAMSVESESEKGGKEYEVQTIIDERVRRGGKEYLIKWKGYSMQKTTWEPESNLNCDDAIAEYQRTKEKLQIKSTPAKLLRKGVTDKQTKRYGEIAGSGLDHRKRHSKRNIKSLGKS